MNVQCLWNTGCIYIYKQHFILYVYIYIIQSLVSHNQNMVCRHTSITIKCSFKHLSREFKYTLVDDFLLASSTGKVHNYGIFIFFFHYSTAVSQFWERVSTPGILCNRCILLLISSMSKCWCSNYTVKDKLVNVMSHSTHLTLRKFFHVI